MQLIRALSQRRRNFVITPRLPDISAPAPDPPGPQYYWSMRTTNEKRFEDMRREENTQKKSDELSCVAMLLEYVNKHDDIRTLRLFIEAHGARLPLGFVRAEPQQPSKNGKEYFRQEYFCTANALLTLWGPGDKLSWARKTWLLDKCCTVDDTYTTYVDILVTDPHVSLKVHLVTVSELLHVEEACNLLQSKFGRRQWAELVDKATAGDDEDMIQDIQDIQDMLGSSVADILKSMDSDDLSRESTWRERKRWFHVPNPPGDCSLPLSASATVSQWKIEPLQGGWYRATVNTYPYRRVRGISIEAEKVAGEPLPQVMVSLAHWAPLPTMPLTGWTHTRVPGSLALCSPLSSIICRKYGRVRNTQKPAMFEYSRDINKQIFPMPESS